jgi:putative transposase
MDAAEQLAPDVGTAAACRAMGVSRATLYRRRNPAHPVSETRAQGRQPRALAAEERQAVLDVLHSDQFIDRAPAAVFAALLDEGVYHCSARTMYRVLHDSREVRERRNQLRHPTYKKPELLATAPNQVWSWDITKLLGPAKWTYYYLYVLLDIYSRYVVGWMLASRESADLAKRLIRETIEKQQADPENLVIHSDRGPSMTSHTVAQLMATLGVTKSHSRPHVSNDNPFSESQFKTLKYRPEFPDRFGCQEDAHSFCQGFFHWYNEEHYHSGIGMLTPASVHYGHAVKVLEHRQQVLAKAYAKHPERFVNKPPTPLALPEAVWINPPATTKDQQKGPPATLDPQKPDAPSAHPRSGYPSSGCVPAEPDSVSPDNATITDSAPNQQPPSDTRAHASKNPRGVGAGPHIQKDCSRSETNYTNSNSLLSQKG